MRVLLDLEQIISKLDLLDKQYLYGWEYVIYIEIYNLN